MRHWNELHQDGEFWCGEFETDDIDWQLAELFVNMQYACQKHYYSAMAEMYFDNKLKEASQHHNITHHILIMMDKHQICKNDDAHP